MSKTRILSSVIESVSNEKGVGQDEIYAALETALASVTAKRYSEPVNIRVTINRETGEYDSFRYWVVVEDSKAESEDEENPYVPGQEILLSKAQEVDPELAIGDIIEEPVESVAFGRIAAQQAKQIIIQKVREAERSKIAERFEARTGELMAGMVKEVKRDCIIVDLGDNVEAIISRDDMIPREAVRQGDRIRALLYAVQTERRGPQLMLTRTKPEFLIELFKIEVPEIGEEVIEIKSAARDPGLRAKIAVKTNDGRIDPIGACVGMRGARVQAVSNELAGERIDIILWDDNPAQLVINAMAPAEVASIVVDEESKSMDIAVKENQLSQAIGRSGQNVRLASELTGWTLNVMNEEDAEQKSEDEAKRVTQRFIDELELDEELAQILVQEGFSSLDEVAYVAADELLEIEGFDEELVTALQSRARDVLLAQELGGNKQPAEDLLGLEGMTPAIAQQLAARDIITQEDLAELAVDDIVDIEGLDEKLAGELIMAARAPWFADQ